MHFPNESQEYREARNLLLQQEIELRRLTEKVAQQRRQLPPGGEIPEDYVFHGDGPVRLSELFEPGKTPWQFTVICMGRKKKGPAQCVLHYLMD